MSTNKIDPSKKDATISSADDPTKTTNKGDAQLSEEELTRVTGGNGNAGVPYKEVKLGIRKS
jgi:hypothetical protein